MPQLRWGCSEAGFGIMTPRGEARADGSRTSATVRLRRSTVEASALFDSATRRRMSSSLHRRSSFFVRSACGAQRATRLVCRG